MSGWDTIIFDLDDTLYAERNYVFSGFRAVAIWGEQRFDWSVEEIYADLVKRFEGGNRRKTFDSWFVSQGLPPDEHVAPMVQVCRQHTPILNPFLGATGLLGRLSGGNRLGLVRDGWLSVHQSKLAALKLERHFRAVVFSDEWGRSARKPNPRPFEIAMERLTVHPARSVYIADNPQKDFFGARCAGMFTVRSRQPEGLDCGQESIFADHEPNYEVNDFVELEYFLSTAICHGDRVLSE